MFLEAEALCEGLNPVIVGLCKSREQEGTCWVVKYDLGETRVWLSRRVAEKCSCLSLHPVSPVGRSNGRLGFRVDHCEVIGNSVAIVPGIYVAGSKSVMKHLPSMFE